MGYRRNPLFRLRRLRWLPRMSLAVVALAWMQMAWLPCVMAAQSAATAELEAKHCAYCPPTTADASADDDSAGVCNYPQGAAVDASTAAAQQFSNLLSCASVHSSTFGFVILQAEKTGQPPDWRRLPPPRSLNLTHCVQLK